MGWGGAGGGGGGRSHCRRSTIKSYTAYANSVDQKIHTVQSGYFMLTLIIMKDNFFSVSFQLQRTLVITTVFVTKDFAVKSNLLLYRNSIRPI